MTRKSTKFDQIFKDTGAKIKTAGDKIKDTAETAAAAGLIAKDELKDSLEVAKGNLASAEDQAKRAFARGRSKASSSLLETQMNLKEAKKSLDKKKAEFQESVDTKRAEFSKAMLEKEIEDLEAYAEDCLDLSVLASEEAILAHLEAVELATEYDELFGDK